MLYMICSMSLCLVGWDLSHADCFICTDGFLGTCHCMHLPALCTKVMGYKLHVKGVN